MECAAFKEVDGLDNHDWIEHHERMRGMQDQMSQPRPSSRVDATETFPSFGPSMMELNTGLTDTSPAMIPTG